MFDINNLKEEGFILAYDFRGFSSWLFGPMCLGRTLEWWDGVAEKLLHLLVDRKQRERKG
jgi:hypothetical protein